MSQVTYLERELARVTHDLAQHAVDHEAREAEITTLRTELGVKNEQLAGKRHIMMETASSRKGKQALGLRDPYGTPTKLLDLGNLPFAGSGGPTYTVKDVNGNRHILPNHDPMFPQSSRHAAGLLKVTGPGSITDDPDYQQKRINSVGEGLRIQQEVLAAMAERDRASSQSMALVLRNETGPAATAKMYEGMISKLLATTEGWCRTYCKTPNRDNDHKIANERPQLWNSMLDLIYPQNPRDSRVQAMHLLGQEEIRPFFVMRMAISYMVREIITPAAFGAYSKTHATALQAIQVRLMDRGKSCSFTVS